MAAFTYTAPVVGGSENTWGTTLNTNWSNLSTFLGSLDSAELAVLDGLTADTAELNLLDGVTATTAELNILDGVTTTAAELNILDGVSATTAEINYVGGVTSAIQTQLDAKAADTTQAEADWEAGTSTTESVVSPAKVKAAVLALQTGPTVVRSPAFASAALNAYSFSHGQGAVPDLVWAELKVTTAQNDYEVGDVVKVNNILELDEDNFVMSLSGNSTTLNLAANSTSILRYVANRDTGNLINLADSNVELYLVGVWF